LETEEEEESIAKKSERSSDRASEEARGETGEGGGNERERATARVWGRGRLFSFALGWWGQSRSHLRLGHSLETPRHAWPF